MKILHLSRASLMAGILAALLCGCGKQSETQSPAASGPRVGTAHPLPPSPLIARCEPGKPGGRLVIATISDPKTFNPITASETSSTDITLHMNSGLLTFDAIS